MSSNVDLRNILFNPHKVITPKTGLIQFSVNTRYVNNNNLDNLLNPSATLFVKINKIGIRLSKSTYEILERPLIRV